MKTSKHIADHYIWGDNCDGWRLVQNKDLSVIHEQMPPHTSEVRHYHEKAQQFFFILSGKATIEVNGEAVVLSAQEGVEIPALVPHQMFNNSDEPVQFLVISQPATKGDRIVVE